MASWSRLVTTILGGFKERLDEKNEEAFSHLSPGTRPRPMALHIVEGEKVSPGHMQGERGGVGPKGDLLRTAVQEGGSNLPGLSYACTTQNFLKQKVA